MMRIVVILISVAALVGGCAKKGPAELSLEQVPNALKAAFATARTALRTNADAIAKLVLDKQYVAASVQLQAFAGNGDLSDEQRSVVAGATIAVNTKLQEIAALAEPNESGAPAGKPAPVAAPAAKEEAAAAAAVLEHHIRTK